MNENIETRHPSSPAEAAALNTSQLRENFLFEKIFDVDKIPLMLSFYDRFIAGGVMPVNKGIELSIHKNLKVNFFFGKNRNRDYKCW